jgi:hypothetical protein
VADHPVKVPPELFTEWLNEALRQTSLNAKPGTVAAIMADRAAQWGADQELEACCEWLRSKDILEPAIDALRATRRPKPPSLAEQGMEALRGIKSGTNNCREQDQAVASLAAALTRLAELEAQQ